MRLPTTRRARLLVLALLLSVAGTLWRWSDPYDARVTVDTTQYARVAFALDGHSPAGARAYGLALRCHYWRAVEQPPSGLNPQLPEPRVVREGRCDEVAPSATSASRRYESIFDARPGYPALVAVLLPVVGRVAFPIVALTLAVLVGLALGALCAFVGATAVGTAAGIVALYTLPTGLWMTRLAPEGGMYLGLLVTAVGVVLALRGRSARAAYALTAGGVALTFAFKSADAVALAVAMTLAVVVLGVATRSLRRMRWLAAALLGPAIVLSAVASALGAPGFTTSLDDTFSEHFSRPVPRHPWHRLTTVDVGLLRRLGIFAWPWTELLLVALAVVVLVAFAGRLAAPVLAFVVVGVVVTLAHPVTSELARLMAPVWLAVAVGIALVATRCGQSVAWRKR